MKKVEVTWVDAQSSLDFWDIEELKKSELHVTKSCGYLIHQDKERVILGFMLFGEENVKHHQVIPKGMIKEIKELKWLKKN